MTISEIVERTYTELALVGKHGKARTWRLHRKRRTAGSSQEGDVKVLNVNGAVLHVEVIRQVGAVGRYRPLRRSHAGADVHVPIRVHPQAVLEAGKALRGIAE